MIRGPHNRTGHNGTGRNGTGRIGRRFPALVASILVMAACSEPTSDGAAGDTSGADAGGSSITLYTSEPQAKIDRIVAAFNEEHPDIEVEVFRAGTGDLNARIAGELETGSVDADVLLAADAGTFEGYKDRDLLLDYRPADIEALEPSVVDPEGYYVGTRIIPTVIAHNTASVDTPPDSWRALTDPQWAGRIVMPNPDVSGAAAYNAAVWMLTPALGEDWIRTLGANDVLVAESNGPAAQAVADGSRPVGVVVDYLVRDLAAQGSPVAVSYPSEGVPFVSQPVGIFRSSDNPEGAEAFVDFLVSEKGQRIAVEQNYLPVRSDVGTPSGAPELDDITLLEVPLDQVTAEQPRAVEVFREAVTG